MKEKIDIHYTLEVFWIAGDNLIVLFNIINKSKITIHALFKYDMISRFH